MFGVLLCQVQYNNCWNLYFFSCTIRMKGTFCLHAEDLRAEFTVLQSKKIKMEEAVEKFCIYDICVRGGPELWPWAGSPGGTAGSLAEWRKNAL